MGNALCGHVGMSFAVRGVVGATAWWGPTERWDMQAT
jgi:hypothetical protein